MITSPSPTPPNGPARPSQGLWPRLRDAGKNAAHHLFLDKHAAFWLDQALPLHSFSRVQARVVEVIDETHDTKTFVLEPNAHWTRHRAGQFVTVQVEVEGVYLQRCYSISSRPRAGRVSITVKRVPGGRVSCELHDRIRRGSILRLSAPAGEFVLPYERPARLLFIAGGSGITPILSMIDEMAERTPNADATLVYYCRSHNDVIGRALLERAALGMPNLRLHFVFGDSPGPRGFEETHLRAIVPDFAERLSFLCGPAGLMTLVEELWEREDAIKNLSHERFAMPTPPLAPSAPGEAAPVRVTLRRSGREVTASTGETLLGQLESAGERPPSGCRMGICQTCKCRKISGTVKNVITGVVSSEPNENIQLCITTPSSDVELSL
ncbi:MAG: ferredoxin-NADP reductase [Polyangiales bacterium]|jgi:ferredoxin-NADP reductase